MAKAQIATFLGGQPGISIAGNHAYGYSGIIENSSSTVVPYLKFKTGKYYLVGEIAFFNTEGGNSDTFLEIKLNGVIIVKARYAASTSNPSVNLEQPVPIIIPPMTVFEGLLGTDVTQDLTMTLTGRVYDA
tara:strand:- start:452 stop:844 length:393 start_codon:yes stop_codon:yes gene_type:complete